MPVDVQYFPASGTWVKPPGAVRVDMVLAGAGSGAVGTMDGQPGERTEASFPADELPDTLDVIIGKGGRGTDGGGDGADGCVIIRTHLAG